MDSVKDRLILFIKCKGISQSKFEKAVGLSNGYVNNIRKSIQPDKIKLISSAFPDFNTGWLLAGEGDMLKPTQTEIVSVDVAKPIEIDAEQDDDISVRLLPISAQAGTLDDFSVSLKQSDSERIISPIKGADFAITVSGDSMAPEYPNGSQILVKKINHNSFIEWGRVYVLDTTNGIVIKIINQSKDDINCLVCTSINYDQERYAPFMIPKNEIIGMYRVMLCMSMK